MVFFSDLHGVFLVMMWYPLIMTHYIRKVESPIRACSSIQYASKPV